MQYADTRFPGFAMRIKEDQCSYTNHQNNVTYCNIINNTKFKIANYKTKAPLPLSFIIIATSLYIEDKLDSF